MSLIYNINQIRWSSWLVSSSETTTILLQLTIRNSWIHITVSTHPQVQIFIRLTVHAHSQMSIWFSVWPAERPRSLLEMIRTCAATQESINSLRETLKGTRMEKKSKHDEIWLSFKRGQEGARELQRDMKKVHEKGKRLVKERFMNCDNRADSRTTQLAAVLYEEQRRRTKLINSYTIQSLEDGKRRERMIYFYLLLIFFLMYKHSLHQILALWNMWAH